MCQYYICNVCGNLIEKVEDGGNIPSCCGRQMTELKPASTDGALEKHVPVLHMNPMDNSVTVSVGASAHPSLDYHHITWISIQTTKGYQRKHLNPGDAPEAVFYLAPNEAVLNAYAYCNLHGLWCS